MHSYNHLWQHMVNQDNVKRRYRDASKHKTKRRDVKNALAHVDARAATLTERLENGTWIPPAQEGFYATSEWAESEDAITQVWSLTEIEQPEETEEQIEP